LEGRKLIRVKRTWRINRVSLGHYERYAYLNKIWYRAHVYQITVIAKRETFTNREIQDGGGCHIQLTWSSEVHNVLL